jgi:antitoxin component of MazEF toxin-antitoxin module
MLKVQMVGGSLMISIPKWLADQLEIEKGTELSPYKVDGGVMFLKAGGKGLPKPLPGEVPFD